MAVPSTILGFIARGFLIAALVTGHSLYWFVGWLAHLLTFRPKLVRQKWFARRLAGLLRALGATFIKVGQIMSTRPDLLPRHITEALEHLQDDVGSFSASMVERTIEAELGVPVTRAFATFDPVPIASASVAQVHDATLPDGRRVAVKVQRPGLDSLVRFDLTVMRIFARFMTLIPSIRLLAPVESVDQFGAALRMQMDFEIEADNNRRFTENFAGFNPPGLPPPPGTDSSVIFPEVLTELSARRVLTMSFETGTKVLDTDPAIHDHTRLARIGFQTLLKMVFEDGFVHADLHPGNIFVNDKGQVVILDLGLTAELDDTHRKVFAQFFASWAARDGKTMARLMIEFSPGEPPHDMAGFEADVEAFLERFIDKKLGEVAVSEVVFEMMKILRSHRVRVNPIFTMCNIAIAVTEGIGRQLDDTLDLLGEAGPFFARLHAEGKLMMTG